MYSNVRPYVTCNAGLAPDESAYNTLISACAKSGDVDKAFETFRRMEVDGIAPSVITFSALMDSLSRRVIDVHYNAEETVGPARCCPCPPPRRPIDPSTPETLFEPSFIERRHPVTRRAMTAWP